jgi:hypothetical protein
MYFNSNTPVKVEGFQTADTLHPSSVTGGDTSTSYTIFDPTFAYVQADVFETEYGSHLSTYLKQESDFINSVINNDKYHTYECKTWVYGELPREDCSDHPDVHACYDDGNCLGGFRNNLAWVKCGNWRCGKYGVGSTSGSYGKCWTMYCSVYHTKDTGSPNGFINLNDYVDSKIRAPGETLTPTLEEEARNLQAKRIFSLYTSTDYSFAKVTKFYNDLINNTYYREYSKISRVKNNPVASSLHYRSIITKNINCSTRNIYLCKYIAPSADESDYSNASVLSNTVGRDITAFKVSLSIESIKFKNTFKSSKTGQTGGQLYKTLPVIGTISSTNKQEIRDSIRYAMYFNFTDQSTTHHQICVEYNSPNKLYYFPDCSGMNEFYYHKGEVKKSESNITHNASRRQLLTDAMFKLLPYHTRDYIRRWANARSMRIESTYAKECELKKKELDTALTELTNTIRDGEASANASAMYQWSQRSFCNMGQDRVVRCNSGAASLKQYHDDGTLFSITHLINNYIKMKRYDTNFAFGQPNMKNDYAPYFRFDDILSKVYYTGYPYEYPIYTKYTALISAITNLNLVCCKTDNKNYVADYNPSDKICTSYNLTSQIAGRTASIYIFSPLAREQRTYNEIRGNPNNPNNYDIAPKYDLMSIANNTPVVYNVKSKDAIVGANFILTKEANGDSYTSSIYLSTSVNTAFLKPGVSVNVEQASNSKSFFQATIKDYNKTTGLLELKNTYRSAVIINGAELAAQVPPPATFTPFNGTTDNYIISYIDMSSIQADISQYEILYPVVISPTASATIALPVPLQNDDYPVYSKDDDVTVSSVSDPTIRFNGKVKTIKSKVNENLSIQLTNYTEIEIDRITNINGSYGTATAYIIMKGGELALTRFWLSTFEKRSIINAIAQKYYDLNNGTKFIRKIYDIYQVGDTIFDVRFREFERDVLLTETIQRKIGQLYSDHMKYRLYNLSESELLNLELTYTTKMIELNKELDKAVKGQAYDCGINARYVRIQRTDTGPGNTNGIELSQVYVIDSTGKNAAYKSLVKSSSTYIYPYEKSPNLTTAVDANGDNSYTKVKKFERNQCLVDQIDYGNIEFRSAPNIYRSATNSVKEYVTIDLGTMTSITKVILYFPHGYTETPTYQIKFLDSLENEVILNSEITTNSLTKISSSNTIELQTVPPSRIQKTDMPSCATILLNPYKVARFYATIDNSYVYGNPASNISKITFTGYSLGVEAALTFNKMYNAGFEINLMSESGNINIEPSIQFNSSGYTPEGSSTSTPVIDLTSFCTNSDMLINIMRDYSIRTSSYNFLNRNDIVSVVNNLQYDDQHSYNPRNILSYVKIDTTNPNVGKCGIKWQEDKVNLFSNKTVSENITRWGLFTYVKNTQTWGGIDVFYDIENSTLYRDEGSYNSANPSSPLPSRTAIPINKLLPYEDTLDDLNGICPGVKCSDTEVIRQLISQYNDRSDISSGNQILRVTRAVTPDTKRCDYGVYLRSSSNKTETKITFNVTVATQTYNESSAKVIESESDYDVLDKKSIKCKYNLTGYKVHTSADDTSYIQTNTPRMAQVFNYVSEVMKPYVKSLGDIKDNLTKLIGNASIEEVNSAYTKDVYGAYGQLERLEGCQLIDSGNKCTDPTNINSFINHYNSRNSSNKRIISVLNAGTKNVSNVGYCDYVISVSPITGIEYNTSNLKVTSKMSNPTTEIYRVRMVKNTANPLMCSFNIVDGTMTNNTSKTTAQEIKLLKPVAYDKTPWTTPITIATQTIGARINPSLSTVSIPILDATRLTDEYPIGTMVNVVDMTNANNNFNAAISSYNTANGGTIVLNNITNISGTFDRGTTYTIREIPPDVSYTLTAPVEGIDYIDCKSPVITSLIGSPPASNIINIGAKKCQKTDGTKYEYTLNSAGDPNIQPISNLTADVPWTVNPSTFTGITFPSTTSAVTSITATEAKELYSSIIADVAPIFVSTNTWDFRINKSDYLPFIDTYKRIEFTKVGNNARIKRVFTIPYNSNFAFFKQNPTSTENLIRQCVNCVRDFWNIKYDVASDTSNKRIMGDISETNYSENDDSLTFRATVCEYGKYGPMDVRNYSTDRKFKCVFKRKYGATTATYSKDTISTNTIIIYSIQEQENLSGTNLGFSLAYGPDSANYTKNFNDNYKLRSKLQAFQDTHQFRYLRFKVTKSPISDGPSNMAAEITQINFYANTGSLINKTPLNFIAARFRMEGIDEPSYSVYTKPIMASSITYISITVTNGGSVTFTGIKLSDKEKNFTTNMKVLAYDTINPTNYFRATVSSVSDITTTNSISTINITVNNISGITGVFTSASGYTITEDACKAQHTVVPDVKKISYEICINNNIATYNMINTSASIDGVTIPLPCSIGYDRFESNKCRANWTFSLVNKQNFGPNIGTPRLKLNIGQYLYIDLNNLEKIDYFDFMTGVQNARPLQWLLQGSIIGGTDNNEWIDIHSTAGDYSYEIERRRTDGSYDNKYSFLHTRYFAILPTSTTSDATKNEYRSVGRNYMFDPSTYNGAGNVSEAFQNPTILDVPTQPKFRRRVPVLENSFTLPLKSILSTVDERMPFQKEKRIQYLRFKIINTRNSKSPYIHMSQLNFITPLGSLPSTHYKITNPMGIHPLKGTGPESLSIPGKRWVSSNFQPLLIKFSTYPATTIQGFQFSVPDNVENSFDAIPCEWIMEGSYDGRLWEIYHKTETDALFYEYESPVYKFIKEI